MDLPILINLDESTFIFRGIKSNFSFLIHISMNILKANSIATDEKPLFANCGI